MKTWHKVAAGAAAVVVAATVLGDDAATDVARTDTGLESSPTAGATTPSATALGTPSTRPSAPSQSDTGPAPAPSAPAVARELLQAASGGDGDSWRDTAGREYRLGLVNTPERDECYGSQATAERKALTARGFRAQVYERDRYGRQVAVVRSASGVNVNVHLARHGFADDRFLAQFRDENPALAAELDRAFAAARQEGRGLWSACGSTPAAAPAPVADAPVAAAPAVVPAEPAAQDSCHPDYVTCLPVRGDGSGRGKVNDLDCGDIGRRVEVRRPGVDPYRLDADGDGVGCQGYQP